jgi:QWRF family
MCVCSMEAVHLYYNMLNNLCKVFTIGVLIGPILQANVLAMRNAVSSAVDIMQATGSSICFLLSKVRIICYFLLFAFIQDRM